MVDDKFARIGAGIMGGLVGFFTVVCATLVHIHFVNCGWERSCDGVSVGTRLGIAALGCAGLAATTAVFVMALIFAARGDQVWIGRSIGAFAGGAAFLAAWWLAVLMTFYV